MIGKALSIVYYVILEKDAVSFHYFLLVLNYTCVTVISIIGKQSKRLIALLNGDIVYLPSMQDAFILKADS